MGTGDVIALRIGHQAPATPLASLRSALDRALALLGDVCQGLENEEARATLRVRFAVVRGDFGAAHDPERIGALAHACFEMCEQAIHTLQAQEHERSDEVRRLVAVLRDTVSLLIDGGTGYSADMAQAATRLTALLRVNDASQLKQRLTSEIGEIQRVAAARQEQWRHTVTLFETRIATLETQLAAVKQEALVDPLTGIANRRHLEQAIHAALQSPDRELIVAMFDLDNFKGINDAHGHAVGDAVLRSVAQTIKNAVRKGDLVARLGGDEFALVGPGATLRAAEPRLRSVVDAVAMLPVTAEGTERVSVSCGVVEYSAGDTAESLMRRADDALYEAKRRGKNRVVTKSPPFIRDLRRGKA